MNTLTPEEMRRLEDIILATDDHELQSELWIFLHDQPDEPIDAALASVVDSTAARDFLYDSLNTMLKSGSQPQAHTEVLLDALSPVEHSVVLMIMIGMPKDMVRKYKSLSCIRYDQIISAIIASKAWEIYLEKEADIRRKTGTRK